MSGSIYSWSTTAGDNDDADGDINWTEGQNAKTVNNSARQMMGRVAELLLDLGGQGTVGGTANAITLTLESSFTALVDGLLCSLQPTADNTGAATVNVNSIGSKSIRKFDTTGEVALAAKDLQAGNFYLLIYDTGANSSAGAWIVLNPTVPAFSAVAVSGSASDLSSGTLPDARLPARLGTTTSTIITDWNDAVAPGWYRGNAADNGPSSALTGTSTWVYGRVDTYSADYCVQTAWPASAGISAADTKTVMRVQQNGTWTDWFRARLSEAEQQALWDARYPSLTNLASTSASKGASLVGVQDSAANFSGTTVEAVLAELASQALGQTFTDYTSSGRVAGTVYHNTSSRTILVGIRARSSSSNPKNMLIGSTSSPATVVGTFYPSSGDLMHLTFPVPPGWYYKTEDTGVGFTNWWELS